MIKNYFRNRKEANNKVCQVGGLNIEFIQQPLEKNASNYVKPTLNIYGSCTEAEKKKMQASDIFNVTFCPPLTEEQKIKNSEELKDFPGILCQPVPHGFWDSHKKETYFSKFIKMFI